MKATVDAYTGEMALYIFDPTTIIQSYQKLFPSCSSLRRRCPPICCRRYPGGLFLTQAGVFHMRDPQVFYNRKISRGDCARSVRRSGQPEPTAPTYVVATRTGEQQPVLADSAAPAKGKDSDRMDGARCSGDQLGKLMFYHCRKQH